MDQFLIHITAVLHQIPHGKVTTYGTLAQMAGYPSHARQVGKALSNLPSNTKQHQATPSYLGIEWSIAKVK